MSCCVHDVTYVTFHLQLIWSIASFYLTKKLLNRAPVTWDGAPLVSVMPLSLSRPPEPGTAGAGVTGEATAESGARARPSLGPVTSIVTHWPVAHHKWTDILPLVTSPIMTP